MLSLNQDDARALGHRGVILSRLGRYDDALAAMDQSLRLSPDRADFHSNRGELMLLRGSAADAITEFREAIRLRKSEALESRVLLAVLIRNDDTEEAAELCRAALEEDGRNWSVFRRSELRALAYLILHRVDEAEAELSSAIPHRELSDVFQKQLYGLLIDPPVQGRERLLAVWREIDTELLTAESTDDQA